MVKPSSETETPPAFSEWMRRNDPTLDAEKTNCLFQAFYRRRKVHGRKFFAPSKAPGVGRWDKRNLTPFLPRRLSDVYSEKGILLQAATDIWLTPNTGRDIVETLYLEGRLMWKQSEWFAVIAYLLIVAASFFDRTLSLMHLVFILATAYFVWQVFFFAFILGIETARQQFVMVPIDRWLTPIELGPKLRHTITTTMDQFLSLIPWMITAVFVFTLIGIFLTVIFEIGAAFLPQGLVNYFNRHSVLTVLSAFFITIGCLTQLTRKQARAFLIRRYQKSLEKADSAYEKLIVHYVLQDKQPHQTTEQSNA